eukprot:s348_g19.t1
MAMVGKAMAMAMTIVMAMDVDNPQEVVLDYAVVVEVVAAAAAVVVASVVVVVVVVLVDSAARSHRQLSRAIKRFDDSLQELVDLVLSSASSGSVKPAPAHQGIKFSKEVFALTDTGEISSGQAATGRVSDSDEFWGNAQAVVGALPSMLGSLERMIGQQLLPDSLCLSAAAGSGVLEVAEDLCSETECWPECSVIVSQPTPWASWGSRSVLESLQDQETTLPVKRRRLQGLKDQLIFDGSLGCCSTLSCSCQVRTEICSSFGFVPRPVHDSSFDVADFFCSILPTPFVAEKCERKGEQESASGRQEQPPPKKQRLRLRSKQNLGAADPAPVQNQASSFLEDFKTEVEQAWARSEDLMYEILHLALRLHSMKSRPKDLTAGEMQAFQNAVVNLADTCGACMTDVSLKVPGDLLRRVFVLLDRLLEGPKKAWPSLEEMLQSAIGSFESTLAFVQHSEEYRCCRAAPQSSQHVKESMAGEPRTDSSQPWRPYDDAMAIGLEVENPQEATASEDDLLAVEQQPAEIPAKSRPANAAGRRQTRRRKPANESSECFSLRGVLCCAVSFGLTFYLGGVQMEVSVLTSLPVPRAGEVDLSKLPAMPGAPSSLSASEADLPVVTSSASTQEAGLTSSVAPATGEPAVAVSSAPSTTVPVGEIGYVIPRNEQCPKGTDQVMDLQMCLEAAAYLKKKLMSSSIFTAEHDPPGCIYRSSDRDIFFNGHPEGGHNPDRRPVCRGAIGLSGISQQNIKPVAAWDQAPEAIREEASRIRLFCFAWTPFRPSDEAVLQEVRTQFSKCDGHAFFSDRHPHGETDDVIIVKVPEQRVPRTDGQWLYHRNMVGLMPTWTHLLKTGMAEEYDWVLNAELDHFTSPSRCRLGIVSYLENLRSGSGKEQLGTS